VAPTTVREVAESRVSSGANTLRSLLLEVAFDHAEGVPHASVVRGMQLLGFQPDAARQALSRAARSGALLRAPDVPRGVVRLSPAGREGLQRARDAMLRPPAEEWDGSWVVLMVRNPRPDQPHRLRTRLLIAGLGSLGGGVWITPSNATSRELIRLLADDEATEWIVSNAILEAPGAAEIVARAWDLQALRTGYAEFRDDIERRDPRDDEERFIAWIEVVRHWQHLREIDPGLPAEVVGDEWAAHDIVRLLTDRRRRWRPGALRRFASL